MKSVSTAGRGCPQRHFRVAADFYFILQRVRLVDENVPAPFQQTVVTRRIVAVSVIQRHDRVPRVVREAITRLVRRVDGRKRSVAVRGVRRSSAMQEEIPFRRVGRGPFICRSPPVGADHIESGRGPVHRAVRIALQPVVEPLDDQVDVGDFGVGSKVERPRGHGCCPSGGPTVRRSTVARRAPLQYGRTFSARRTWRRYRPAGRTIPSGETPARLFC